MFITDQLKSVVIEHMQTKTFQVDCRTQKFSFNNWSTVSIRCKEILMSWEKDQDRLEETTWSLIHNSKI